MKGTSQSTMSKFECAHLVVDYRLATHMRSDVLTQTTRGSLVNLTFFCVSVTGFPLRFTHVRMEHTVGTSEETMGLRLVPNGRTQ